MTGHAGARAAAARPARLVPPRRLVVPWTTAALVAAAAWVFTITRARSMGDGPGTMGLALPPFLGLWIVMMAAMMLPSVAPVAVLWAHVIGAVPAAGARVARMTGFLGGYLLAWSACGIAAFAALTGAGRLAAESPAAAHWLGAAILAGAGAYQFFGRKDKCLRSCRSPIGALLRYMAFRGPSRDVRVGLHHGATCVGCCWGLMVPLIAVGVMNVPVMAALAVVIFIEKTWRYGKPFAKAVGILLIGIGLASIWLPWLLPGLHGPTMAMR